jgi:DNA-binding winged helix-turn-helix (wHTH) protein/tetratricopeptide (TPR) repeat protein
MSRQFNTYREFDAFRLNVETKVLWHRGEMVEIPVKAVEVLIELTRHPGEVIKRDELLDAVWGDAFVEETNLSRNIYILRKALKSISGREYIKTLPRRGYRFESEVEQCVEHEELTLEHTSFSRTVIEELQGEERPWLIRRIPMRSLTIAMSVGVLLLSISAFSVWRISSGGAVGGIRTLAILPPISPDTSESGRALVFGVADALISRLGSSPDLVVRPLGSVMDLGEQQANSVDIGRKLKVEAVLESTLQETGGRIRLQSRLVRVSDGKQIWSGQFDTPAGNVFRLQDVLAAKVYDALISELALDVKGSLAKTYTNSPEAYQAYRRGRHLYFNRDAHKENFANALKEFELALSFDPNFVLALTGLADIHARAANVAPNNEERKQKYELARGYAARALELDPNLAEAHASMGWIKRNLEWDWAGAENHFRTAIALTPNSAEHHRVYSFLLTTLGRHDEAVDHARLACELDPSSLVTLRSYSLVLNFARQYEASIEQNERAFMLDPSNSGEFRYLLMSLFNLGRYQELLDRYETFPERARRSFHTDTYRAMAYFKLGQYAEAEKLITDLRGRAVDHPSRIRLAVALVVLGIKDEAFDILEDGMRAGDDRMLWVKVQPEYDAIRNEPRYQAILSTMNLAD